MAVEGSGAQLVEALLAKVGDVATALSPVVKVSNPNVAFTPDTARGGKGSTDIVPYLTAAVLINDSALTGLAYDSPVNHLGLLTLNVVWPAGQGVIKPLMLAAQIVRAFKPGTRVSGNGIVVRIDEQPRVAPDLQENDRVTVPIIIRWTACTPAN